MSANDKWRGSRVPLMYRGNDVMAELGQAMTDAKVDGPGYEDPTKEEWLEEHGHEWGIEIDDDPEFGREVFVGGRRGSPRGYVTPKAVREFRQWVASEPWNRVGRRPRR